MPPDEREWLPPPEPTSRLWDAFLAREPSGMGGSGHGPDAGSRARPVDDVDPAIAETIRRFHALDDAPAPDVALTERIWRETLARAGGAVGAPATNGHRASADLTATVVLAGGATARQGAIQARTAGVRRWSQSIVREVGIAVLAGAIAGFVVVGGGARLIMRVLAMAADPTVQGRLTENGERVGEITVAGTLGLMFLCMLVGAGGGLVYALVRPWLPWSGWRRGLVFGLLLTATFGSMALEGGDNPDYRRFGLPFLNVCLFNLLPLGLGLAMTPLVERLDRIVPRELSTATLRGRLGRISLFVVLALLALPAGLLLVGGVVGRSWPTLAVAGFLLIRWGIASWAGKFERPSDLLARPAAFATAYAVLLVPTVAGLVMTLRSAGRILGYG